MSNVRRIFDISMPLAAGITVWPGDPAFDFHSIATEAQGANANVGAISMCVHTGTHVDAPFHVDQASPRLDALDLATFVGPAVVLDVRGHFVIEPADLHIAASMLSGSFDALITRSPRLLLRTDSWANRATFPDAFPTLSLAAAELVVASGAILLGVDVPSADPRANTSLPIHHTLIGRRRRGVGVQILENLALNDVSPGVYELIALPLKLIGADGSPVRAVLIEDDATAN